MKILLLGLRNAQANVVLKDIRTNGHRITYCNEETGDKVVSTKIRQSDLVLTTRCITHKAQHTARSANITIRTVPGGMCSFRAALEKALAA